MKDEEASLGKDYKDGDTIFEENSIGKEMYIILTGNAKVIKKKDGAEDHTCDPGRGRLLWRDVTVRQ